MAGGFQSSGFKNTFGVEKRDDGSVAIIYEASRRDNWTIFSFFLSVSTLTSLMLPIGWLFAGHNTPQAILWLIVGIFIARILLKPIKAEIIVHKEGLEFLGKKLALNDINETGVMISGGGTSVYSVNGNIQSSTNPKTYALYATAFGQNVLLTKQLRSDAQASGILEAIRLALRGQNIQIRELNSSSNLLDKAIYWVLNNKAVMWGLGIIILLILLI